MKKITADSREMNSYWDAYEKGALQDWYKVGTLYFDKNSLEYQYHGFHPSELILKLSDVLGVNFAEHDNYWALEKLFLILHRESCRSCARDLNTYGEFKNRVFSRTKKYNNKIMTLSCNIIVENGVIKTTNYTLIADGVKLI